MTRSPDIEPASSLEQAVGWCLLLNGGTDMSPNDEKALDAWLALDDANVDALRHCSATWALLGDEAGKPEIIARRADALNDMRRANRRRWGRPVRVRRAGFAWAAALLGMAGAATWFIQNDRNQTLLTEAGERRALVLDDGSRVSMDAKTRVSVSMRTEQRALQIDDGRAKFDVAYDPQRPFTVAAGGHIVLATGTSFSTELVDGELHVIVYEGKVVILDGAMPNAQTLLSLRKDPRGGATALMPGQEFVAAGRGAGTIRRDTAGSLAWEAGRLEFVDEPLGDAVAQLNRYSTDAIAIVDPRVADIKVNGAFRAGNSAAFFDAIARLYPVVVQRSPSGEVKISAS